MTDRGHLLTEQTNAQSAAIDRMSVADAFDVMSAEDATVATAVAEAKESICQAIELVVGAFRAGGRLVYVGAGTSGRLGVLDASECPPTFRSDPRMVQGIIAGGNEALRRSIEGAEDDRAGAVAALDDLAIGANDIVMGITTGGTTPFVHGAISHARSRGAKTVFFACVPVEQAADDADVSIRVLTGPEVITGSTRLKAGTATKLVLNMITTLSMVGIGKVHGHLMVDMNAKACAKLRDRGMRVLCEVTGISRDEAAEVLDNADGRVKTAIVMVLKRVDCEKAESLLNRFGGRVADALAGGGE